MNSIVTLIILLLGIIFVYETVGSKPTIILLSLILLGILVSRTNQISDLVKKLGGKA